MYHILRVFFNLLNLKMTIWTLFFERYLVGLEKNILFKNGRKMVTYDILTILESQILGIKPLKPAEHMYVRKIPYL